MLVRNNHSGAIVTKQTTAVAEVRNVVRNAARLGFSLDLFLGHIVLKGMRLDVSRFQVCCWAIQRLLYSLPLFQLNLQLGLLKLSLSQLEVALSLEEQL